MSYQKIKANDGSGEFDAYIALPENAQNAPAIIVIQEIFGVNAELRKKCDLWAEKGYIAISPDLFWRQEPGVDITDQTQEEWDKAFALFNGFDPEKGLEDLRATLDYIRGHDRCNGKVGNIGYCLGGKLSFMMATGTDVDMSVSYYGVGLDEMIGEVINIQKPLLMHIAEEDKFVDKDAQAKILAGVAGNPHVTAYSYAGVNHAFTRLNGEHFDAKAAKIANDRTNDFVKQHLG